MTPESRASLRLRLLEVTGPCLKKARQTAQLNQVSLAKRVGCTVGHIRAIEAGTHLPSMFEIFTFLESCGRRDLVGDLAAKIDMEASRVRV